MDPHAKKYKAAGQPPDVVEYRAQLAASLRDLGVPIATFVSANKSTSFPVTLRSLQRHVKAVDEGHTPLSAEKKTGRRAKLTDEQWRVVAGAILLSPDKTVCNGW